MAELVPTEKLMARNRAHSILKNDPALTEEQKKAIRAGAARAWYADLPGAVADIPAMALDYGAEGLKRMLPSELAGYDLPKALGIRGFQRAMKKPAGGSRHLEELGEKAGYIPPTTGTSEEEIARLAFGFVDPVPLGAIASLGKPRIFTSPAVKAVSEIKQDKMPANQWISQMRGRGVNKDELYWTGVEDWLKSKKGSVTRQELDEYLEANQIQVQEVVYGQAGPKAKELLVTHSVADELALRMDNDERLYEMSDEIGPLIERYRTGDETVKAELDELFRPYTSQRGASQDHSLIDELRSTQLRHMAENPRETERLAGGETKFGDRVLPGGENYRELVLHYPNPKLQKAAKDLKEFEAQFESKPIPDEFKAEFFRLRQAVGEAKEGFPTFTEGHFPEPNTIAWIRFNERVMPASGKEYRVDVKGKERVEIIPQNDPYMSKFLSDSERPFKVRHEGSDSHVKSFKTLEEAEDFVKENNKSRHYKKDQKVLFIEEIQSDWGHKGLEEGFGPAGGMTVSTEHPPIRPESEYAGPEVRSLLSESNRPEDFRLTMMNDYDTYQEVMSHPRLKRLADEEADNLMMDELYMDLFGKNTVELEEIWKFEERNIPAGPFVMDTHQWSALALKRMVRWAADEGFDSIAWTSGKQQADRYNLSKHLDQVNIKRRTDDSGFVVTGSKDGVQQNIGHDVKSLDELDNVIGKELADKTRKDMQILEKGDDLSRKNWSAKPLGHERMQYFNEAMGITPGRWYVYDEQGNLLSTDVKADSAEDAIQKTHGRTEYDGVTYSGVDLELGGDYVKFIYDDVLPAQAKKLGKKYGAKVETSDVGTAHTLRPVTGPPGTWHVYDPIIEDYWMDPETLRIPSFNSREEAAAVIKGKAKGEKVWSMNLTDKLKQAAKDGLPYYVALPPVMAGAMKEENQEEVNQAQARQNAQQILNAR
jgi:hypothetical protein